MYLGSSWNNDQIDSMTEKRRKQFSKDSFYASAATVKEMFRDIQHPSTNREAKSSGPSCRILLSQEVPNQT